MLKKILIMLLSIFFTSKLFSQDCKIMLNLGMNISEVLIKLDEPEEISIKQFETNSKFDVLTYFFNGLEVTHFRANPRINSIKINSSNYAVSINDINISIGTKKSDIVEIFGNGTFLKKSEFGNNIYYYPWKDMSEFYLMYNNEDEISQIIYKYDLI